MLKATVSGSFHRHMPAIEKAVNELIARGVEVLSPADPRIVDYEGEFLFVASDRLRSVKLVQDRHFEAIGHSDFLWVVCPDGYAGASTCMEIGDARRAGVPVFSDRLPNDITIRNYVQQVPDLDTAIALSRVPHLGTQPDHILLNPGLVASQTIDAIADMGDILTGKRGDRFSAERSFAQRRAQVAGALGFRSDRKYR